MKTKTNCVALIIFLLMLLVACGKKTMTIDDYLTLGNKYLLEENYEQAVVAFMAVIEIEPRNIEANTALGDIYVKTKEYEKAIEYYEKVCEIDNTISDCYLKLAECYVLLERPEQAIACLKEGYEITKNRRLKEQMDQLEYKLLLADATINVPTDVEFLIVLKKLYSLLDSGDIETVQVFINSEEFQNIASSASEGTPILFSEDYDIVNGSGRGIGIYCINHEKFGRRFVYFGDYNHGLRTGSGLWLGAKASEYYIFTGTWSNDRPNGTGNIREWYGTLNETVDVRHKYGNLVDGLWDGNMNWEFLRTDGSVDTWPVQFNSGIVVVIETTTDKDTGELKNYVSEKEKKDGKGKRHLNWQQENLNKTTGVVGFEQYTY